MSEIPVVEARLESGRDVYLLIVNCPYCGKEHTHGAGLIKDYTPGCGDGHRVAHCHPRGGSDGYIVRERAAP